MLLFRAKYLTFFFSSGIIKTELKIISALAPNQKQHNEVYVVPAWFAISLEVMQMVLNIYEFT